MEKKTTVVNIIYHTPAYKLMNSNHKFIYDWNTASGEYIGFDAIDWPDVLTKEIIKRTDKYSFEVWQPDYKADKIYSKKINDNYLRKLFPTKNYYYPFSFHLRKDNFSRIIIEELLKYYSKGNIIVHLNSLRGILTYKICETFKDKRTPIIVTGHGSVITPKDQSINITKNPLKKLSLQSEEKIFYSTVKRLSYISDENLSQIKYLKNVLNREIEHLTIGINFSEWDRNNVNLKANNEISSAKDEGKKIFLTVAHLISRKRIDLMIKLFLPLSERKDFCLVIVGNGTKEYEKYLRNLGSALIAKNQLIFINYTTGDKLKSLYAKSDFFITTSLSEGTQVASIYATAMCIPIISTENNGIADLLKETSSGYVLKEKDLNTSKKYMTEILNGEMKIKPIPYYKAKEYFDWDSLVEKYLRIYDSLNKT